MDGKILVHDLTRVVGYNPTAEIVQTKEVARSVLPAKVEEDSGHSSTSYSSRINSCYDELKDVTESTEHGITSAVGRVDNKVDITLWNTNRFCMVDIQMVIRKRELGERERVIERLREREGGGQEEGRHIIKT